MDQISGANKGQVKLKYNWIESIVRLLGSNYMYIHVCACTLKTRLCHTVYVSNCLELFGNRFKNTYLVLGRQIEEERCQAIGTSAGNLTPHLTSMNESDDECHRFPTNSLTSKVHIDDRHSGSYIPPTPVDR